MKIALVAAPAAQHPAAPDDIALQSLARALGDAGHRVAVHVQPASPRLVGLQAARPRHTPATRIPARGALDGIPEFTAFLRARWARERPDVVHAAGWTGGLAALTAARDPGIPVVQSFVCLGVTQRRHGILPAAAGAERIRLEAAIGRTAGAVIAGSAEEESDLIRLGVDRRLVRVVPWGVDTAEFTPDGPAADRTRRARLITMAAPDGHDLASRLRMVVKVPDAELVIVAPPGTGPARRPRGAGAMPASAGQAGSQPAANALFRAPAALAGSLGIADRVLFADPASRRDMPALLRSADLFLADAACGPSGMACLEAMACGVPVVASPGGALADIVVDGTAGILVPPGRPDLVARRIRQVLAQPMLLQGYSVAAADRARSRYSWDRIARETLAVYREALQAAPAAA